MTTLTTATRSRTAMIAGVIATVGVGFLLHPLLGVAVALLCAWRIGYRVLFGVLAALMLIWAVTLTFAPSGVTVKGTGGAVHVR